MASVARAIEQASSQSLDASLWWDSHQDLFQQLDFVASSRSCPPHGDSDPGHFQNAPPAGLAQKLSTHHLWLLELLTRFKPPSATSRSALNVARVVLGSRRLDIKTDLKNMALQLSALLVLDEVQTYILVSRFFDSEATAASCSDHVVMQKITLKYYLERQCLLKCTRLILFCQMAEDSEVYVNGPICEEMNRLVRDGLEDKALAVLRELLTVEQPPHLDMDFTDLWAEQTVVEQSLLMDILFLLYYEPLCPCNANRWKDLFLMFQDNIFTGTSVEKLSLTKEAEGFTRHVKHQAVLIIIEALDLEKLLMMVFDEVSFRKGGHAFSYEELRQVDGLMAKINPLDAPEYGLLLMGWATFACLLSFLRLPAGQTALEIDHTFHMRQAYEGGAYIYLLNMLRDEQFQASNAQVGGYKSVVKTLLAAFLAAYDIGSQNESGVPDILIDIFYEIYSGQEALCIEFWDRESVVDGPIRSLLSSLRDCFPYQLVPLVRLLAGLCEGPWPAECTYDFLYKMVEITSLYEHPKQIETRDNLVVQTLVALEVPGASGLLIPAKTNGYILRVIDDFVSLVRWECKHSAMVVLLVRMLNRSTGGHLADEVYATLNLLSRMLLSNKMLAQLMLELDHTTVISVTRGDGRMEGIVRIDVVSMLCSVLNSLMEVPGDFLAVALCLKILETFALCCSRRVMSELSGSTLLQPSRAKTDDRGFLVENLSKMILDSERFSKSYTFAVAVVELCGTLVGKGIQSDYLSRLALHIIKNVFVNHMNWKYKQKHEQWQITTKVLDLMKICLEKSDLSSGGLRGRVMEALLDDASIHEVLLQILSVGAEGLEELYLNRQVHIKEIEWFEQALIASLTILHLVLELICGGFLKDSTTMTQLEQTMFHYSTGKASLVAAVASLLGFSQNVGVQSASVKAIMSLCLIAQKARPHPISISSYIDIKQRKLLRAVMGLLLHIDTAATNFNLFKETTDLFTCAARFQPSFIQLLLFPLENYDEAPSESKNTAIEIALPANRTDKSTSKRDWDCECLESIMGVLRQSESLTRSRPHILSPILFLLRTFWQGGTEYLCVLEALRSEGDFWKVLTTCISGQGLLLDRALSTDKILMNSFQYQCQALALQIMTYDTFLQQQSDGGSMKNKTINGAINCDTPNVGESCTASSSQHVFVKWCQESQISKIIQSYANCLYNKETILRAKDEARALTIGLIAKFLSGDEMGLSASLVERIQQASKAVLDHSSFQELHAGYSARGYGNGCEAHLLVLSDLFHHLQGEIEGGRQIPAGPFQHLTKFLDRIEIYLPLQPLKPTQIEGLRPPFDDGFVYDTSRLKLDLGMDWWPQKGDFAFLTPAAESTLHMMQCANEMASLGESQLIALKAFTDFLIISTFNKKLMEAGAASLNNVWTEACLESCIEELCKALESSIALWVPLGDSTNYMPRYLAAQAQVLMILVRLLSNHTVYGSSRSQLWLVSVKVVRTVGNCLRPVLGLKTSLLCIHQSFVRCLLTSFLICLELMQSQNEEQNTWDRTELKYHGQNEADAFVDVALVSMGFLPMLCSFVETKDCSNLSIAAINVLVRGFLAPPTWLPILQKHFPVRLTFLRLRLDADIDFACQALNLFLSLLQARGGAEMLQSADLISQIMLLSHQLREDDSFSVIEKEGPFCVRQKITKKRRLWGLGVAIVAAVVHSLGEKDGGTIVKNALLYFESTRDQMLCALQPPTVQGFQGKKKSRYQHRQTTLEALQETEHVLLLMIELVHYQTQWSHVLQGFQSDLREMCIHLLAYIAREGLVRNLGSSVGVYLQCPPNNNEELSAHSKSSIIGSSTGWFAVTARGCEACPTLSSKTPFVSSALILGNTRKPDAGGVTLTHTLYSDMVALQVYKISSLVLQFLCKQVQQAVKKIDEDSMSTYANFPELPAPEILYGLQDQVIAVITEVCGSKQTKATEQTAQQVCPLLLGIMEKSMYLEVCLSRICGIAPLSLRSEDFLKEYKNLLVAMQGHHLLDVPLESLKGILGLAYPDSALLSR